MGVRTLAVCFSAALALLVAACDPPSSGTPMTGSSEPTTTVEPTEPAGAFAVAIGQITQLNGYTVLTDTTDEDTDRIRAMQDWLSDDLVETEISGVAVDGQGNRVAILSVLPPTGIRGYPWLAELVATEAQGAGTSAPDTPTDVIRISDVDGGPFFVWTNGDGFLIAASEDEAAAEDYSSAMVAADTVNDIWAAGTCLALDQVDPTGFGTLPWAPFPRDLVVPCDEVHHAEVIYADVSGVSADAYDEDRITYDRAYVCDEAYNDLIGSQADHTPSVVTYAPDADEWERGDRYLACVIRVPSPSGGEEPFTTRITESDDLEFDPEVGVCTSNIFTVERQCNRPHPFQFVGSVLVELDEYPTDRAEFDEFCEPLASSLTKGETVTIIAQDIEPWSFEQGVRTLRCFAGVLEEGLFVNVTGSFFDRWNVISGDGIPA